MRCNNCNVYICKYSFSFKYVFNIDFFTEAPSEVNVAAIIGVVTSVLAAVVLLYLFRRRCRLKKNYDHPYRPEQVHPDPPPSSEGESPDEAIEDVPEQSHDDTETTTPAREVKPNTTDIAIAELLTNSPYSRPQNNWLKTPKRATSHSRPRVPNPPMSFHKPHVYFVPAPAPTQDPFALPTEANIPKNLEHLHHGPVKLAGVKHHLHHPALPSLRRMERDDVIGKLADEHCRHTTTVSTEKFGKSKVAPDLSSTETYHIISSPRGSFEHKHFENLQSARQAWSRFVNSGV